ncbi:MULTISPECIES: SpoIIIAC/SpoIIIAD family protein [unclassified Ruminococcus]|uniref:SpoIIIAC/SpoIIIAD family protein n=1 Tax=unclassified Ruminococcus TaxID=2608920 RepID=UPI00210D2F46|nr:MULTISPECIES: SpoIIIAC/SpoIIIAD family protein [unclassified Ruminococcus]MCQ4022088.1 stage III sporulation protein AD [Ruminococcus sp. zg-924]MCQ4114408.1 stage III sporulation protein AD [Ruminococcus sp. zg-921]
MDIFVICILAAVAAVFVVLLKKYNPEIAMLTALITGIIILSVLLTSMSPAIDLIKRLSDLIGDAGKNVAILLKSIGICYICQFSADSCRDAGQGALAGKVELAGKIAVVLLCLPLLEEIINYAVNIIGG